MYKITLYDKNCNPICDSVACFFTEDIDEFERKWVPLAGEKQVERFQRSKAGEMVSDYYDNYPEHNIVQVDKREEVLYEEKLHFSESTFTLYNTYWCETKMYVRDAYIRYRGIRFNEKYYLIGDYHLCGVCRERYKDEATEFYETIIQWGNPICDVCVENKERWSEEGGDRRVIIYPKEAYDKDEVKTFCWVCVEEDVTEGELLKLRQKLTTEEMLAKLMRDIPGEAG